MGKSSLLTRLLKEHPQKFGFSVSHTTRCVRNALDRFSVSCSLFLVHVRAPRPGEVDGKNYWFTNKELMQKEIEEGKFIEWNEYAGNLYGTSKRAVADVAAAGKICIFDVDMNGINSLKKTDINPIYVMIVPPSREELERRLRGRGDTAEDAIQKRLKQAEWELSFKDKPDFWDHVITNDDLERAYAEFKSICVQDPTTK